MKLIQTKGLSFDDVLLIPQHSDIASRDEVSLGTRFGSRFLQLPIISANMDSVTEDKMAIAMAKAGGAGILHRFGTSDHMSQWLRVMTKELGLDAPSYLSVGVDLALKHFYEEMVDTFGLKGLCVDVAHGDHTNAISVIKELRSMFPHLDIIAGNVAIANGAQRLIEAGANVIKVGIGPGSVCSTRVVSGHGVPQLTAIDMVAQRVEAMGRRDVSHPSDYVSIIADGGIRYPGDIVKALAAGADCAMIGSLLAGTDEAAGEIIVEDGIAYKSYRGMASLAAQKEKRNWRKARVEGVSAKVPYRGPVTKTLQNLEAGIRSGLSYSGARTIKELQENAEFIEVSSSSIKESHPHHPYKL